MAASGKGNSAAARITAIDDTAQGIKQAGESIKKLGEELEPVKIKTDASNMEKSIHELRSFVSERRAGGYSDEVLGIGRVSTLSKLRSGVNGIGKEFGSTMKSNLFSGISTVAIGASLANAITGAIRSAWSFAIQSAEVWEQFEGKAKIAFSNALTKGFTGNFDVFAKNLMRVTTGLAQTYNVSGDDAAGAAQSLSKSFTPGELTPTMAAVAKISTLTGRSMTDWAEFMVKFKSGALQMKQLTAMGIEVPKGVTGEEQGEQVSALVNKFFNEKLRTDDSTITMDRPAEQLQAFSEELKLSIGSALDEPIKEVLSFLRNELLGRFGSMEAVGATIVGGIMQIVNFGTIIAGIITTVSTIIVAILRGIVAIFGTIGMLIFSIVNKFFGTGEGVGAQMDGWMKEMGAGFKGDWSNLKTGGSMMLGVLNRPQDTDVQKRGAAIYANQTAYYRGQAQQFKGVAPNAQIYEAERQKKAEKERKENAKQTILIQAPYGIKPVFANSFAPNQAAFGRPMRRY